MYETILYELKDNIATITLNRPQAYNSFNGQMLQDFLDVWAKVKDDDDVHVVVLRAAPCPAFCTGADVSGRTTGEGTGIRVTGDREKPWKMEDPSEYLGPKTNRVWKPVIVAVTAFSMPRDREKVLTAGIDGYLSKPIEPETFVADIEAFLPANLRSARPATDT